MSLKKQKKDVISGVQKEKSEKKVPKKVESSDSSDSEEEEKVYNYSCLILFVDLSI